MRLWRWFLGRFRRERLPVLSEADSYAHCHPRPTLDVRVVPRAKRNPRVLPHLSGDYLRSCFEERLARRRQHAA
jgi:hypothetical protein